MNSWISTHDSYPNKNQCVDVWVSASDVEGRVCNCFIEPEKDTAWYWNESCEDKIHINLHHVSHWMSAPPAPWED